jgi:outer membrane lipoprotein-sorting protein
MKTRTNMQIWPLVALLFLVLGVLPSAAMDGEQIARKVFDRDDGQDATAKIRMLLINKQGKKRFRRLISVVKKYGDVSKIYMRFESPPDIEGTAFLTWENKDGDDDQFLYLPALRRERRIVSSQKSNSFVNTDYSYEDLQTREVERDHHRVLGEEKIGKYPCWILESIPKKKKDSQYSKRVSWIIKGIYLPVKTEFYDRKGRLQKVLTGKKIKKIDGIWTILDAEMKNLQKKHRTLMKTDEIRYNTGVPDDIFTIGYLKHTQ